MRSSELGNFLKVVQLIMEDRQLILTLVIWKDSLRKVTFELHLKERTGLGETDKRALPDKGPVGRSRN